MDTSTTANKTKEIPKVDTRLHKTGAGSRSSIVFTMLFAMPFIGIGIYFTLVGLSVIPYPGKINAPMWTVTIFGVIFAMAGISIFISALLKVAQKRHRAALAKRHPNQPWFLDYPWDPIGIRDKAGKRWRNALYALVFLVIFMTPFNWWAFLSGQTQFVLIVVTVIFDFVILLMLGNTIHLILQFIKYGYSQLSFARFPFFIGEILNVGFSPKRCAELQVTLRFVEELEEIHGSGKNQRSHHICNEHYGETKCCSAVGASGETLIEFEIPSNPEWVNIIYEGEGVRYWELVVEAEQRGINFRTTFPLPIYYKSEKTLHTKPPLIET